MAIDLSSFRPNNVADTCAVWNVLSSPTLFAAACDLQVLFVCTQSVIYECLFKRRRAPTVSEIELRSRLLAAQRRNSFVAYPLEISDLQTVRLLQARKRVGMGELASIAFAERVGQAVLTDDQMARKLAETILVRNQIQTTPHLLGWLFFKGGLSDGDRSRVLEEHAEMGRPLAKYFEEMYREGCRCRLMTQQKDVR